jgi:hypothetical protein
MAKIALRFGEVTIKRPAKNRYRYLGRFNPG